MFALLEKLDHASDVLHGQVRLSGDLRFRVAPQFHSFDIVQQVERTVLSPRNVLDKAHHQAVLFARLDNDSGDLRMAKGAVRLEPALAADKIELPGRSAGLGDDRYRSLEAQVLDAPHDPLEGLPVSGAGVGDGYLVERDLDDVRGVSGSHRMLPSGTRAAISYSWSSVSKRKESRARPLCSPIRDCGPGSSTRGKMK